MMQNMISVWTGPTSNDVISNTISSSKHTATLQGSTISQTTGILLQLVCYCKKLFLNCSAKKSKVLANLTEFVSSFDHIIVKQKLFPIQT